MSSRSISNAARIAAFGALWVGCGRLLYEPRGDAGTDAFAIDASSRCPFVPGMSGMGACPEECTGGCDSGACIINCNGPDACSATTIACPGEWPCVISCAGPMACNASDIDGSGATSLSVRCTGERACLANTLTCPTTGGCDVTCGADACGAMTQECGAGSCTATCAGGAPGFDQTCGTSSCCDGSGCL